MISSLPIELVDSGLSRSDWIQLIFSLASILFAGIAIFQSNKSMKLTRDSILEANRPVLVAYFDFIKINKQDKFLIIKNFGSSPAVITSITTDLKDSFGNLDERLLSLNNSTFAPNQKLITELLNSDGKSLETHFEVKITYRDNIGNTYNETFQINPTITHAVVSSSHSNSKFSEEHNNLMNVLQNMMKELK